MEGWGGEMDGDECGERGNWRREGGGASKREADWLSRVEEAASSGHSLCRFDGTRGW